MNNLNSVQLPYVRQNSYVGDIFVFRLWAFQRFLVGHYGNQDADLIAFWTDRAGLYLCMPKFTNHILGPSSASRVAAPWNRNELLKLCAKQIGTTIKIKHTALNFLPVVYLRVQIIVSILNDSYTKPRFGMVLELSH